MLATRRIRNPNWTDDEIFRLLELLQEKEVLKYMRDNRTRYAFHYISAKLTEEGREKTPLQCKVKLKNLKFHWKTVAERVPFLETADLEDEAHMMMLLEECEKCGISSFNVRHVRMLKRFLDGLASLRNGIQIAETAPPLNFTLNNSTASDESGEGGLHSSVKIEDYELENNEDSGDVSQQSQSNDESVCQDDCEEYNPLSIVEVTTVEDCDDETEDTQHEPPAFLQLAPHTPDDEEPPVLNKKTRSLRELLGDGLPSKRAKMSTPSGHLVIIPKPNRDEESSSKTPGKLKNGKNGLSLAARVQMQLADKFVSLQRESNRRAFKFEQDQLRMEQSFLETWRLAQKMQLEQWRTEQRTLMDKWRSEQREHEERMLNIFTNFIAETTKLLAKNGEN